jgi:hypothetical protein
MRAIKIVSLGVVLPLISCGDDRVVAPGDDQDLVIDISARDVVVDMKAYAEFGNPCAADADCASGFCVPSAEGSVCTTISLKDVPSASESVVR